MCPVPNFSQVLQLQLLFMYIVQGVGFLDSCSNLQSTKLQTCCLTRLVLAIYAEVTHSTWVAQRLTIALMLINTGSYHYFKNFILIVKTCLPIVLANAYI